MASEKITAMPNLAGGQVPTDLIPAVDLSALPASQNVKTTLNDLFSTVTKNITDRALRFQAAGSTPGLSTPTTGALYFDGSTFQASQNGGAWTAVVLAGSITTCGLTQKTARMLGRTTAGNGAIEEISIGSGLSLAGGSLSASGLALSGLITASGLTQNTARILGRTTAGTGAIEEVSIGSGLSLAAGSLAASGLLTASGYTQNTARLIGRSTAGVGAVEEISIGSGLSLAGGSLSASGLALSGLITASGLTQNTARILGRTTAGTGAIEEVSIGSGLALAAGSLAASGLLTASGYTQNTARLIGRSTAGVGAVEEISIGSNLSLAGGILSATGGAPGGASNDVQYNSSGTFAGSSNFQFRLSGAPTVRILANAASSQGLTITGAAAQTAEIVEIFQGGDNAAALLTLQQGVLSTLTSNFPFRFEDAGGTLILGLRARPATGIYQFVSPGANTGTVVYEVGTLGSNNGLGLATGSQSPSMFAGNIQCVWWSGSTGNTVFNQAYQATWGTGPTAADAGLARPNVGILRVTNGSTTAGQLLIGANTDATTGQFTVYSASTTRNAIWAQSASGSNFAPVVSVVVTSATNTATTHALSLRARSTGSIANGFGGTLNMSANTTTTADEQAAEMTWSWTTATHATRSAKLDFSISDFNGSTNRLTLTPTTTQVPTGQLVVPSINQLAGQLQGLAFYNGSFYGSGIQSNATGTPVSFNSIFMCANRGYFSGAFTSAGFDGSLVGNALAFTQDRVSFFGFAAGSNTNTTYAIFDGVPQTTLLNAETVLRLYSFLGSLNRVRYGAAGSATDAAGVAGRVLMI